MLGITYSLRHHRQGLTTSDVSNIEGNYVVKLRGMKIENNYKKILLNEYDNYFEEKLNDINYNKTFIKLHHAGLKNSYFTCSNVSMLGYGWGVSQYPQFYDKDLDMYQLLPGLYIGSFDGFTGHKLIKKGCYTWQVKQKCLSWNVLKPG